MGTKTLLTLADYERLPQEEGARYELDEGELVTMTFPMPKHARAASNICHLLLQVTHRRKLGQVLAETGFLLSRDPVTLRGPDVSFVRAKRAAKLKADEFIEGAPDLAVEIVSPSDSAADLMRKVRQYLKAGAHTVWVVYLDPEEVHVFEATGTVRVVRKGQKLEAPELIPGFSVKVEELFA